MNSLPSLPAHAHPTQASRWHGARLRRGVLHLTSLATAVACAACAAPGSYRPDASFGQALRDAQALQTTAAPGAKGGTPSISGVPARAAVTRYEQSFETPARATQVMNIGIGASGSAR